MTREEQDRYTAMLRRVVELYPAIGVKALESGSLYDDADYKDALHLVPSGGRRLANEVSPRARNIAHELYAQ